MIEQEKIEHLPIKSLIPFQNHPFKMRDGEEKEQLRESIKTQGVLQPLIVRPLSESEYEVISGHRRLEIMRELGIDDIPVIIKNLTDEQAIQVMVDSNINRENLLPSERAFAYRMKLESMNRQGFRSDLSRSQTLSQVATKLRTNNVLAEKFGIGKDTLHRYIRLTYLIPELLKLVDEKKIAFTPAVELSYLTEKEQQILATEIEYVDATPSLSQAQRLRDLSRQGRLNADTIYVVMSEIKPNQKEQIRFKKEDIAKYFPKSYTDSDMQEVIINLLEKWLKQRQRKDRDSR